MAILLRSTAPIGSGASGDWADVFATHDEVGPLLATDGLIVGLRGANTSDFGSRVSVGNGGSITHVPDGSFDGLEDRIDLVPPSSLVGENADYCGICNGTDLWDGGANNIAQINIGWCMYIGATYANLGPQPKLTGVLMAPSLGAETQSRAAIFEGRPSSSNLRRVFAVTANTVQSYHQPDNGTTHSDPPDTNKLIMWGDATANHSANPPVCGLEWLYFEQEVDCRQNRGNANGINRLKVWTRDGVLSGRHLEIPLDWDEGWSFANNDFIAEFEYLGGFWNDAGTANANNFVRYSHVKYSANRSPNDHMGPPPGFVV